ncbi:MAG: hypothetical protein KDA74_08455, partial [Planctomycetaceae bacterium]|nr:hypothetical protein [Planctomycetaceae bacterium]
REYFHDQCLNGGIETYQTKVWIHNKMLISLTLKPNTQTEGGWKKLIKRCGVFTTRGSAVRVRAVSGSYQEHVVTIVTVKPIRQVLA